MATRLTAKSKLEETMAFNMKAVGIPAPVRELHFDWCCEHSKPEHARPNGQWDWCIACDWLAFTAASIVSDDEDEMIRAADRAARHEYAHRRDWRFDFAWPAQKVALEIEGGTWTGGRHTRGKGFEEDAAKYAEAAIQGWKVLRATGAQVHDNTALGWVEKALKVGA